MKKLVNSFIVGLACLCLFAVPNTKATLEVGASISISASADFYAPLTPAGTWVEVESYGRCFRPSGIAVGWRPYCDGSWVWTDCGWYWVSDEPWAWACYHYGYWVDHPGYGWVWMPGVEWAPAWVTWRYGGGYVGWAPIAPRVGFSVSVPAPPFFFVEVGSFHKPIRPSTVIVNNTTIINKTTVIGGVSAQTKTIGSAGPQKVMFNAGPSVTEIQKATGGKVRTTPIQEATRQTPVPRTMEHKAVESQTPKLDQKSGGSKKEQAPVVREPSGTKSEHKFSPSEPAVAPEKPVAPKESKPRSREEFVPDKSSPPSQDRPHSREQVAPSPQRPAPSGPPPERHGREKGEEKGHGKDHP